MYDQSSREREREQEGLVGMAGTSCMDDGDRGQSLPASLLVATVADLLTLYIQKGHPSEAAEFSDLCLSLARGIDYAVANNEIPFRARDLPYLLKQVLRRMNDSSLQAVAMVLMIAVKNACKIGWFLDHDATNLLTLAKEIGKDFSTMEDIDAESQYSLIHVPNIMSRYYPRLQLGHVLASLEVKPGYGAYVVDFHLTRSMVSPVQNLICLFVAQTDDMDTSSCIVTPPQVNFLLNGKGVRGRINVSMDNGPQLPTNVTAMLKYGINLLQVVGQFDGNYVIIIAFMSVISTSGIPHLPDYVQPVTVTSDSDLEIIEGQARISLNCPISFRRINIPVKGHLCKHHQCFDYGNFIQINSRRPSWRCPHCNQFVCNPDIRIDQTMAKILREVGENVVDVIISPDGSWKSVVENIDTADQMNDSNQSNGQEANDVRFSSTPAAAVDLTMEEDMEEDNDDGFPSNFGDFRTEDLKPFLDDLQLFPALENRVFPGVDNAVQAGQDAPAHRGDNLWTGGVLVPSSTLNAHSNIGISSSISGFLSSPVLTDAVSPSLFRESLDVHKETQLQMPVPSLQMQNQHFNPIDLQLQQSGLGSFMSNEYGRLASTPRHVGRIPIAVQALPAQVQHTRSIPTPSAGVEGVNGVTERDRQFSRSLTSSVPVSGQSIQHVAGLPKPAQGQHTRLIPTPSAGVEGVNGVTERDRQFSRSLTSSVPVSGQSIQHVAGLPKPAQGQHTRLIPTPSAGVEGVNGVTERDRQFSRSLTSSVPVSGQSIQHVAGLPKPRTAPAMNHQQNIVHPSINVRPSINVQPVQLQPRSSGGQVSGSVSNRQSPHAAALRSPPSVPVQLRPTRTAFSVGMVAEQLRTAGEQRRNMVGTVWPNPSPDASPALPTDNENWRPSGRMRGSLTGEAYSAALSQFMIQPTQPVQPATNPSSNLPRGLPAFGFFPGGSNERNAAGPSPAGPQPRMRPFGGGSSSSGTLPEWPPRMP